MYKIVIVIDRLLDSSTRKLTIGGIQTYLQSLSKIINDNYSIKVDIFQFSDTPFELEFDTYNVVGSGVLKNKNKLFKSLCKRYSPLNTIIIWGSDQYSVKQNIFKSVGIQHGIGFDLEAIDDWKRKLFIKCGFKSIYKLLQGYNAASLARNADYLVCVDYNFLNWARTQGIDTSHFNVIPNFTNVLKLEERKTADIVIARRFVRRRGIDLALEVIEKIINSRPNTTVVFAGSGPEVFKISKLIEKYPNNIELTTYKNSDSLLFHSKFKVSLIPSIGSEGTSLSLLESMSASCVPIVTNVGGMTNIVLDGFNGFIRNPNVDELYMAALTILNDEHLRNQVAENARATVVSAFSYKQWEQKWVNFLYTIMHN